MAEGFGPLVLKLKQQREAKLLRKSVLKHFQHLEDPRAERGRNHREIEHRANSYRWPNCPSAPMTEKQS